MTSSRSIPGIRAIGGIVVVALAIMPRHIHALTPQNKVCTDMFNLANATGKTGFLNSQISSYEKSFKGGPGSKEFTWTVTLNAPGSAGAQDYEHNIWLGTPPNINLNDGNLPFSACAIVFTDLPYNTILSANSAPSGDCAPTFGQACVDALTKRAADIADSLTQNCSPGANSNCSITSICPAIFSQLGSQNAMPKECVPYFNPGTNDRAWPSANVSAITSNAGDHSKDPCFITPKNQGGFTFVPVFSLTDDNRRFVGDIEKDNISYDNLTATPEPILTVFMPPANGTRALSTVVPASAQMRCIRPESTLPDSRAIPQLPPPTPVVVPGEGPALTTGAIAGIVVGAVLFVAILIAVGIFLWRRRRRARDRAEATRMYGDQQPSMTTKLTSSGSVLSASTPSGILSTQSSMRLAGTRNGSNVYEAPPASTLNSSPIELPPDAVPRPVELNGAAHPTEMAAHEARVRQSLMSAGTTTPASAWPQSGRPFDVYQPQLPPVPSEISSPHGSSDYGTGTGTNASHPLSSGHSVHSSIHSSPHEQYESPQVPQRPERASGWSYTATPSSAYSSTQQPRPPLPPLRTSMGRRGWMTPVERKTDDAV